MKKILLLTLLVLPAVVSCGNNKKQPSPVENAGANTQEPVLISQGNQSLFVAEGWAFDTLAFNRKIYIDSDTTKGGVRIEIDFEYPVAVPEGMNLQQIQHIFAVIFSVEKDFQGMPQDAFDTVVNYYTLGAVQYGKEWKEDGNGDVDFPDCEDTKKTAVKYISEYLAIVSSEYYMYLGGAHGSYALQYENIDLKDASIITEEQLFATGYSDKLAALIQKEITRRNGLPDESEHIMLLAELNEIKPNGNFFFSKEGIIYIYNQYEIAPYAQGVVEITIPYDEIKPLINRKYIELIDNIQSEK